ncbi:MAG: hypothetical protein R2800_03715 [Flavipsychrobacter sp.]
MGRLSIGLLEYAGAHPEYIPIKDSISFCCLGTSPNQRTILELNSFAILNESLQGIIDDFINGISNANEVVSELSEDIDVFFHLLAEESKRLKNIFNITQGQSDGMLKLKEEIEIILNSYDRWKQVLSENDLEEISRISDTVLESYNKILSKKMSIINNNYSSYALISFYFLILALLSNLLKQGISFISNKAPRLVSYYKRATNYAIVDSFTHMLSFLEKENDGLYKTFIAKTITWPDKKCLTIEGDIKSGFVFKIYTASGNEQEKDVRDNYKAEYSFLNYNDIILKYEDAMVKYANNSEQLSFVMLAINNCNNYAKVIMSYIKQIEN